MAVIRSKDVRKLGESEFKDKLAEVRKELLKLRAQKSAGSFSSSFRTSAKASCTEKCRFCT